jgi:hypothetical protein
VATGLRDSRSASLGVYSGAGDSGCGSGWSCCAGIVSPSSSALSCAVSGIGSTIWGAGLEFRIISLVSALASSPAVASASASSDTTVGNCINLRSVGDIDFCEYLAELLEEWSSRSSFGVGGSSWEQCDTRETCDCAEFRDLVSGDVSPPKTESPFRR